MTGGGSADPAQAPDATATEMTPLTQEGKQGSPMAELAQETGELRKQYSIRTSQGYAKRDSQGNLKEPVKMEGVKPFNISQSLSHIDAKGELQKEEKTDAFVYNEVGLTEEEAKMLLEKCGENKVPEYTEPDWKIICVSLIQPMPLMIWAAAIIEAAIQNWPDMGILLGIQFTNCSISFYETKKAGNAVAALKKGLKRTCVVKRRKDEHSEGEFRELDAAYLVPGDCIKISTGQAIPADCRLNEGTIDVDQSQLTGESLPVTMHARDDDPKAPKPRMGSICVKHEAEATVEATGGDTELGQTAKLLQQKKGRTSMEMVLLKIIFVLLIMSFTLCIIVLIYLLENGETVTNALSFTVVLLVASIPLAIEIVCNTTLALGSRELAKQGAIVSQLASIEAMAGMNLLCSDKTGTLTENKMKIQEETPIYMEGETQASVLRYAAMAAKWKEPPKDALDKLVLGDRVDGKLPEGAVAADLQSLRDVECLEHVPFDPKIKRTESTIRENGQVFKVSKGAPHVMAHLCHDPETEAAVNADNQRLAKRGIRAIAVARTLTPDGPFKMLGLLTFLDPPRADTKVTIKNAEEHGVPTKMITGDHLLIAKETARVLEMGKVPGENILGPESLPDMIPDEKDPKKTKEPPGLVEKYGQLILHADGFAQVFPTHKYLVVSCLRQMGYKVGMTGDGVNDAPALKRADVGIAVSGATDVARAAAHIVLTEEGLSTIVHGIKVSRQIFQRMQNFLTYRIAATMQLLCFFFVAVLAWAPKKMLPPDVVTRGHMAPSEYNEWLPFFKMPVLLLMLITLLNDGTLIAIGYDNVETSKFPEKWNLPVRFMISGILGLVAFGSSLLILYGALTSWDENSWFQKLAITPPGYGLNYGQVTTMIYLKVSISDFLTLFCARTGEKFFWTRTPSPILLIAAFIALMSSSLIGSLLPHGHLDGQAIEGLGVLSVYVWIYCVIWFVIQDICKVLMYILLRKYHIFGYGKAFVFAGQEEHNKMAAEAHAAAQAAKPQPEVVIHH